MFDVKLLASERCLSQNLTLFFVFFCVCLVLLVLLF